MGYLIFRGVDTNSLSNVYVSKMPSHKKAAMRYSEYYVKGRDGALHVDEGYSNYDITTTLVLLNAGTESRYQVNAWADGTGKLITSDDLTKAYNASVKDEIIWQRTKAQSAIGVFSATKSYAANDLVVYGGAVYKFNKAHNGIWNINDVYAYCFTDSLFDMATITFSCQPGMVESVDSQIELTSTQKITNPGDMVAYPMIQVNGSGDVDFTFNGEHIYIDDMTSNVPVYIDCQNGYVYTATGATSIRGNIPHFDIETLTHPTANTVTFGSNLTRLVITPHWRWL